MVYRINVPASGISEEVESESDDEEEEEDGPEVLKDEKAVLLMWALYKGALLDGKLTVAANRLEKLKSLITKVIDFFCNIGMVAKESRWTSIEVDVLAAVANGEVANHDIVVHDMLPIMIFY